ncbi:MAG: acyl-CoA dehydrogenase [Rhodospirillaceae bacterium]|nr:acyl-CoA dehydrogenase [Rhodospirillaceae bacterium]MBT5297691.1 acyl-CoA dehydrogenase [Rhodospirillaceae bacterium]
MIPRTLFSEEHDMFRDAVQRFIEKEITPYHAQWEKDGQVSREVWLAAGAQGYLCCSVPEEYGGAGADFLYSTILLEEMSYANVTGPGFHLHSEIVAPYIRHYGTEEQKKAWLPKMARGECIGAIAMTEPGAGSDLQGIKTQAVREGDELVVNGQKVFITNGQLSDLVIVACKTDPKEGAKGISLVVVERGAEGFERGRNLEKIGWHAQDTSELFFDHVRVPASNLLGQEGQGFVHLVEQLPQERLIVAIRSTAVAEAALEWTVEYTNERKAFGKPIAGFQNTRFKLAEIRAQLVTLRVYVDKCIELLMAGELDAVDAAVAKLQSTEILCQSLDDCLQMFGGYGYMWEYPIARAWADNRYARIAGGSTEIMKEIIGRSLTGQR